MSSNQEEYLNEYKYYMEDLSRKVFYFCLNNMEIDFLKNKDEEILENLDKCVKGYGEVYNIINSAYNESMECNFENILDTKLDNN